MIDINPYWERDYQEIENDAQILLQNNITMFEQVFYPVSVFEVTLEEETYEDLEKVQSTILSVCRYVFSDNAEMSRQMHTPEIIGAILGLSPQYTGKVMKLLHGYGYLDQDNMVTELGKMVLGKEQEIHCAQVKQLIYFDQLNMQPVHLANTFARNVIYKPEDVNRSAVIIPCYLAESGATHSDFLEWFNQYMLVRHKKSVLNVNTRRIDDVKCVDRSLIKGYLARTDKYDYPVFITKCYDVTQEEKEERFRWRPLALPPNDCRQLQKSGFPETLNATEGYQQALISTEELILARNEKRKQKETRMEGKRKKEESDKDTGGQSDI